LQEVDENSPPEWKNMMAATVQENHYENLPNEGKRIIDSWHEKRVIMIQERMRKLVESAIEDDKSLGATGIPFVKVLIKVVQRNPKVQKHIKRENKEAMLTIWRVTDEQLNILKEGSVVRVKRIGVKNRLGDGVLQLTASATTQMELSHPQPSKQIIQLSGFKERKVLSMLQLHALSRRNGCEKKLFAPEIDMIGSLLKVTNRDYGFVIKSRMYLTDSSGFVLRVERDFDNISRRNKSGHWESQSYHGGIQKVLSMENLRLVNFDTSENCAVAYWTPSTRFFLNGGSHEKKDQLKLWLSSTKGQKFCMNVLNELDFLKTTPSHSKAIGFIVNISVGFLSSKFDNTSLIVLIDCDSMKLCKAVCSLEVMKSFLSSSQENKSILDQIVKFESTSVQQGQKINDYICFVSKEVCERNQLLNFILRERNMVSAQDSHVCMEISQIKKVQSKTLSNPLLRVLTP